MTLIVTAAWLFVAVQPAAVAYRSLFAAAYLIRGWGEHAWPPPKCTRRFAVLIPAHDEELLIREVIASIRATDYPQNCLDIRVIADNCTDPIRLISSGMVRARLRSPASTWAVGMHIFLASMAHAMVELTSPTTNTRSDSSCCGILVTEPRLHCAASLLQYGPK